MYVVIIYIRIIYTRRGTDDFSPSPFCRFRHFQIAYTYLRTDSVESKRFFQEEVYFFLFLVVRAVKFEVLSILLSRYKKYGTFDIDIRYDT